MSKRVGKKSSTPTKSVKKTKGQRYEYQELAKVSLASSDHQHVYGVIIDASFPYKANKDKYVCSLKIVDPSLSAATKGDQYATVVIYANRFEDLPIVHRLGDLIRLHRATLRLYDNHRQFNLSTHWNGSWALFSTDKAHPIPEMARGASDFNPIAHSGKKASFEPHERNLVTTLRRWAQSYFANNEGSTRERLQKLSTAKSATGDFDVSAKIVSIFEMDEYTNELKLRDASGATYYTLAIKLKFPHLRAGQVVRIRSAQYEATSASKNVLSLSHYSNIQTYISSSKLHSSLGRIQDDWSGEKAALNSTSPNVVVTYSQVQAKHSNLPVVSLHDLFHNADNLHGNTFRTFFTVTRVDPADHHEAVKSYDRKTKKASSTKGAKGGDLVWNVQFLCKDASTAGSNNHYRILNYSHEGLGANFFGKASDLHKSAAAAKAVKGQFDNLLKFNVWVDAVVERRNGFYHIKDTTLKQ